MRSNIIYPFLLVLTYFVLKPSHVLGQPKQLQKHILPAQEWLDNKGKPINAHGGGILFYNGIYYWYGEHKLAGKSETDLADGGIHCYTSTDLFNWTDAGVVLGVDYTSTSGDLIYGCLIERPKVIYNKQTRKFIAYFKFYPKGNGYEIAYVGVAISESPAGPFRYSHKFLGAGSSKGSGDFSMFQDDNGSLYHLAVRKPDKVFVMSKMRDDYLLPQSNYEVCKGIELHTEAPAIIKVDGIYHLLGSGSSGWKPNTARHFTSNEIQGPWVSQGNPVQGKNTVDGIGNELTFGAQSSFIFPIVGVKDAYVAMFDVWIPEMPIQGRYIWLPIRVKQNQFSINWMDKWDISIFAKSK
jgi:hypothetical protein